jgi:hypothetical protein
MIEAENKIVTVQVSFRNPATDQELKLIKDQLIKINGELIAINARVISCHLNREIITEKGWSSNVIDTLELVFGEKYSTLVEEKTFADAMANMQTTREKAAAMADVLYVILPKDCLGNMTEEIRLASDDKVRFLTYDLGSLYYK